MIKENIERKLRVENTKIENMNTCINLFRYTKFLQKEAAVRAFFSRCTKENINFNHNQDLRRKITTKRSFSNAQATSQGIEINGVIQDFSGKSADELFAASLASAFYHRLQKSVNRSNPPPDIRENLDTKGFYFCVS